MLVLHVTDQCSILSNLSVWSSEAYQKGSLGTEPGVSFRECQVWPPQQQEQQQQIRATFVSSLMTSKNGLH